MFVDARTLPDGEEIEADLCIIGGGAAGITLAREFKGHPARVVLLESGGLTLDPDTQALYRGENVGLLYYPLSACRLRYFGGTTNHWGGACWPLEAIDFEERDWVPHSGWPFDRAHLDPFYKRAHEICKLGPFDYRPNFWSEPGAAEPLPISGDRVLTKLYQDSPPVRFGVDYQEEIRNAANIRVVLYANAVEIETNESGSKVDRISAATLTGRRFTCSAHLFVLAAGGLENPRLLLLSDRVQSGGVGNQHDLVGRFFMEHIMVDSAAIALTKDLNAPFYMRHFVRGQPVRGGLGLSAETLRRERILNSWSGLYAGSAPRSDSPGERSWKYIKKSIRSGEIPEDFMRHLGNVIESIDEWARATLGGEDGEAGSPSQGGPLAPGVYSIRTHAEAAPEADSRVTLGEERDALGLRQIRLDWRLSELDRASIRRAQEIVATEVGRAGVGRMQVLLFSVDDDAWTEPSRTSEEMSFAPTGSFHHMGTTRMDRRPEKGVVDPDCRVHATANLFVAGSSVFPTSGYANPTLTIVALTCRLADHLKKVLETRGLGT